MIRARAMVPLLLLLASCASNAGARRADDAEAPAGPPDEAALRLVTRIEAQRARVLLSERWRKDATLEGIAVDRADPARTTARGDASLRLRNLTIVAADIEVKWLPDYEDVVVYATDVDLFHQARGERPYHSTGLSAVTMANEGVSFIQ